jgi:ATP-binding cassette subfamily B protein/subfamily B ATP-binding cassette protein MsbA
MRKHFVSSRQLSKEHRAKRRSAPGDTVNQTPEQDAPRVAHRPFWALIGSLVSFSRNLRRFVALGLICGVTASILKLVTPAATGFIFDYVLGTSTLPAFMTHIGIPSAPAHLLVVVAIGVVVISILSVAIGTIGRYFNQVAVLRLQTGIRYRLFRHALQLPLNRLHQSTSGGITSLLRHDAWSAGGLLASLVFNPLASITQLVGTIVVLLFIDVRMLLGPLVLAPLLFICHRLWVDRIRPHWHDLYATRTLSDSSATETFGGIRVVRSFGRETTEARRFMLTQNLEIRHHLKAWWGSIAVEVGWALLIPISVAALLWYGAARVLADATGVATGALGPADALTTGDLVMFLFYLAMLLEPMATIARSGTEAQRGLAGLERVLAVLELPRDLPLSKKHRTVKPEQVKGRITLQDVSFQYPDTSGPVIRKVSFEIEAAEIVALVGRSGAGKSTLCDLIARLLEPTSGVIKLDGTDIAEIDVGSYRNLVSIVEQDVFLFDGTIADNIAYGRRDASMEEIIQAADAAQVSEFVRRQPKGFDTLIGERGVHLSGGQRQRLAIARALLANPRILIMDEATSDLDGEGERLIQESLRSLMKGRTVLVIAHRLSTVASADRIVMLDHGQIVETGTPEELWTNSKHFQTVMQMQLLDSNDVGIEELV